MKKKLAVILAFVLMLSMIPTTSAFGATKMSISPKSMTLAAGDIAQLNVNNAKGKVTWKSSDTEIATVTKKGVVQGKANGTVTITAKDSKKAVATCKVKVESYVSDENVFEKLKDKILEFIKQYTYSKSEIDAKIGSGGGSSGDSTTIINQCDCDSVKDASDIAVFPNYPVVLKSAEVYNTGERENPTTDVTVDTITCTNIAENSYSEFLNMTRKQREEKYGHYNSIFMKYAVTVNVTGSVSPEYAHKVVQIEFNTETDGSEYKSIFIEANDDGTFSGTGEVYTNKLPKELNMCYINLWFDDSWK